MEYRMEELVPLVRKLAQKYTSCASTSITYEKAEQLMEAVLYCINELEQSGHGTALSGNGLPAQKAYEMGMALVQEKVKKALDLYHKILPEFYHYENNCLYDTFIKGIPEFFKWYDIQFEPQNTILTLDYPVLKDLSACTGIDRLYEFIRCIEIEQNFLNRLSRNYIICVLSKYNGQYREMVDNLCEAVLVSMIGHILAGKPLTEFDFENADYLRIQERFLQMDLNEINRDLQSTTERFLKKYDEGRPALSEYLSGTLSGITVRLKIAADNGMLDQVL